MSEHARDQARLQYESIADMVEREAVDEIHEDALSVQVRSGWQTPGEELTPEEYEVLLCTGGPAVRIVGALNEHKEPHDAELQHQDWFEPWTTYWEDVEEETLLNYVRTFFFG